MTVLYFFTSILLVSLFVSLLIAPIIVNLSFFDRIGAFSAGLLGLAGCFATAYVLFLLLDPDPISEFDAQVPLIVRTLPITGFSAFIWMPIYVALFNRLRRKRRTA